MSLSNQSSNEPGGQASAACALQQRFSLRTFHFFCCFLSLFAFARSLQAQAPGFQLVDRTKQSGLEFRHFDGDDGNKYLVQFMSAGMASLDFDCDGMTDVLALNGCKLPIAEGEARFLSAEDPGATGRRSGDRNVASEAPCDAPLASMFKQNPLPY